MQEPVLKKKKSNFINNTNFNKKYQNENIKVKDETEKLNNVL